MSDIYCSYYTKNRDITSYMVSMINPTQDDLILEPCGGDCFPWEANEDEKIKLGVAKNQFLTLDDMLEKAKDDIFKIHLCQQDIVEDVNVKMARFLPMDECGLGFSPTKSELLLYNHKGQLSEKLQAAFGDI